MATNAIKARITSAALPAVMKFAQWMSRLIKPVVEFTKDTERMRRILEILAAGAGVEGHPDLAEAGEAHL